MSVRTFQGRRMSDVQYNRRFRDRLHKRLGPAYPVCQMDWDDARYGFGIGKPADELADSIADRRIMQAQVNAHRTTCKYWFDELTGEFRVGPGDIPQAVADTIKSAVDGGCRHGTITHWSAVKRGFVAMNDVQADVYCWESLA